MLEKLKKKLIKSEKKNLAVFVDGPNILRKELKINLQDISDALKKLGKIKIARAYLNQYATDKLVEACANQGYEPIIVVGDVDVYMAVDATEACFNPNIDAIAFVTRDSDFLPALIKAKRNGKETIVVLVEEASAVALKNTADKVIILHKGV
ncbi:MAG: TIGR00288 family NYN domain-containing protein [Candidatus Iainarchaeum archaeon]|mgnify:CR=1 FL=1|uniref:TIGR00288 family NYN domain-containing protein n=1 Tax=Candidatus Iainarchaeum sp. TaxID=3101447 RepID=A0A497JLE5_9ARCH|nr:MAG: TIGR00288 family NYN domain-containing protein [Candidatus Diapherotrites archaeon]